MKKVLYLEKLQMDKWQKDILDKLDKIDSAEKQDPKEVLRQVLEIGKNHFGLEFAIISHIVGQDYSIVVQSSPPNTLYDGQHFDLGNTYCSTTLQINNVLAIQDVKRSEYKGHPCYKEFQLASYIGAPIVVNSLTYGTINFSSLQARLLEFEDADAEFVMLLAGWVGSFIEKTDLATH